MGNLLHVMEKYMKEGYQRIKIKIAPKRDLQFIEALRREYPDMLLQHQNNVYPGLAWRYARIRHWPRRKCGTCFPA